MPTPKKRTPKLAARVKSAEPKPTIASIKGGAAYAAWLEALAGHAHLPVALLIEHACREYAERHGFGEPQPKR